MPCIACLGWGSLVWDTGKLPIQEGWLPDGPLVQAEFLRKSRDGRITLVLDSYASPCQSLWAIMATADLDEAKEALRKREGIPEENRKQHVGGWSRGGEAPKMLIDLPLWAESRGVNSVIWTALPRKFSNVNGSEDRPTVDQVVGYLKSLTGEKRERAEKYVRCAPLQIDTPYRRRIEAELGWTPNALGS